MNPIELTQQERDNAFNDAEKASQRQDLKSHCTKIRDGIEKLDKNSGDRAIWELMQNASDLGNNISIEIKATSNSFSFSHNGKSSTIVLNKHINKKIWPLKLPNMGIYLYLCNIKIQ